MAKQNTNNKQQGKAPGKGREKRVRSESESSEESDSSESSSSSEESSSAEEASGVDLSEENEAEAFAAWKLDKEQLTQFREERL